MLLRPSAAPRKVPLWAWRLNHWYTHGRQDARPADAPARVPAWFWVWRLWRLARAKGAGSRAWRRYLATQNHQPSGLTPARQAVVNWARWGVNHQPDIHYTETEARDDYLHAKPGSLPMSTDCSGFGTFCYWAARLPDPNGLNYRYLGFTGTVLDNTARHGHILDDVAQALPGDPIVIGPGSGSHEVVCVEAGADPLVASHGSENGPLLERLSADTREPKRVCRILPT